MPKVSKETAARVESGGPFEDHNDDIGGYTVNFVTLHQDMDLTPLLRGLPDDRCQCPHWGYVHRGRVHLRYADREETVEAGEAFYAPPGHTAAADAGSEFVQFSPAEELEVTNRAIAANMEGLQS